MPCERFKQHEVKAQRRFEHRHFLEHRHEPQHLCVPNTQRLLSEYCLFAPNTHRVLCEYCLYVPNSRNSSRFSADQCQLPSSRALRPLLLQPSFNVDFSHFTALRCAAEYSPDVGALSLLSARST